MKDRANEIWKRYILSENKKEQHKGWRLLDEYLRIHKRAVDYAYSFFWEKKGVYTPEDYYQMAFIKLFEKKDDVDLTKSITGYFFRILTNLLIKHLPPGNEDHKKKDKGSKTGTKRSGDEGTEQKPNLTQNNEEAQTRNHKKGNRGKRSFKTDYLSDLLIEGQFLNLRTLMNEELFIASSFLKEVLDKLNIKDINKLKPNFAQIAPEQLKRADAFLYFIKNECRTCQPETYRIILACHFFVLLQGRVFEDKIDEAYKEGKSSSFFSYNEIGTLVGINTPAEITANREKIKNAIERYKQRLHQFIHSKKSKTC